MNNNIKHLNILVLGAGAVGGYFGALLQSKGVHVTFLVRDKRAEHLKNHGLKIMSPLEDFAVVPNVITGLKPADEFQLVIISCKSYSLHEALKTLAPLKKSGYILPLLNGLSHYSMLEGFFGKERILGGFAHLSTVLDSNGNIVHLNQLQNLTIGALEPKQQPFVQNLRDQLSTVAPFIVFSDDIRMEIRKKLIFISTAAAATCLMNQTMGAISSTAEGAKSITETFELNCRASAFAGHNPDSEWKHRTLTELLNKESTMTSSLLRDMQNSNQVEISILKDMLEINRKAGLHNELLESAYQVLLNYKLQRSS